MAAWTLDWNSLSQEHKDRLRQEAEMWMCPCCGSVSAGDCAVNFFSEVVKIIQERDAREIAATLTAE